VKEVQTKQGDGRGKKILKRRPSYGEGKSLLWKIQVDKY